MSIILAFILWLVIEEYAKANGVDAKYFFIITTIILFLVVVVLMLAGVSM